MERFTWPVACPEAAVQHSPEAFVRSRNAAAQRQPGVSRASRRHPGSANARRTAGEPTTRSATGVVRARHEPHPASWLANRATPWCESRYRKRARLRPACFGLGDRRFGTRFWARPPCFASVYPGWRREARLTPGYLEVAALRLRRRTRVSRNAKLTWVGTRLADEAAQPRNRNRNHLQQVLSRPFTFPPGTCCL